MQTHDIDYRAEAVNLRGYLAFDETTAGRRPGVLVFHEGLGLGEFAMARARMLAGLGYVALAADMFGDRRQARNLQEVVKLVGDLRNEPQKLRARGSAALTTIAALPQVDANRIGAIGFCFGGSAVLDDATCRIMQRRARYTPAMDDNGSPTTGTIEQEITWKVPTP